MADRKYAFVVGNSSSETKAEEALRDLRYTAQLGVQAQKVLDKLENGGSHPGQVIVASPPAHDSHQIPFLQFNRYPAYREVTKLDCPPLEELRLVLGHSYQGRYGGHACVEYSLAVTGPGVREKHGRAVFIEISGHVGRIRVCKRTISYLEGDVASPLTRKMKNHAAMLAKMRESTALERLAAAAVVHVVSTTSQRLSQHGIDLYVGVKNWMVEDGHCLRMFEEIVNELSVKWVMDE